MPSRSSERATNRKRSFTTEVSFHGINTSCLLGTHCYPCLRYGSLPGVSGCSEVARLKTERTRRSARPPSLAFGTLARLLVLSQGLFIWRVDAIDRAAFKQQLALEALKVLLG